MLEKLEAVAARFAELERLLADQDVLRSPERLKQTAKEHSDLREVMRAYNNYKRLLADIEGNEEVAAGDDAELAAMAKEELYDLRGQVGPMEEKIKELLLPRDPMENRNVLIEIRSGTGGEEAALFARELFDMYSRYADEMKWKTEVLSMSASEQGGFKEVIALISGQDVYRNLRFESGVHRVQRVPVTEASGRIHTSAVTVAVLPEAEDVDVDIKDEDLKIDVYRSQGAGGQHVNTTDSAVRITHLPTNTVVVCQDERSQHKNKAKAMKILRSRLLEMEQEKQHEERAAMRKSMVRSGDRSEKIRTYNFPQNRVTDHRIHFNLHKLEKFMMGDLTEMIEALISHDTAERLAAAEK